MRKRRALGRWIALLSVLTLTCLLLALQGWAEADGHDYAFYNGDSCKSLPNCLDNSGKMTYGTLFVGNYVNYDARYRAGSGDGSTNRCRIDHGPIPQGDTRILSPYDHKDSGSIHGRAWQLANMLCDRYDPNSNLRTDLWIHTEETSQQGQTCGTPYDERWCWDGASDYKSLGCVKVKPNNIGGVDDYWHGGSNSTPKLVVDA